MKASIKIAIRIFENILDRKKEVKKHIKNDKYNGDLDKEIKYIEGVIQYLNEYEV